MGLSLLLVDIPCKVGGDRLENMTATKKQMETMTGNFEFLRELVTACNSWNGTLESYEVYNFDDDFFEMMFQDKIEVARATFFGDISNWNDEYIKLNAYGNLESLSEYDYRKELEDGSDEIITTALEYAKEIELDEIIKRYV